MKRNAIVRIVLFSVAILILLGMLTGGLLLNTALVNMDWETVFRQHTNDLSGTLSSVGSVSPEEINNIQIDWASGSITIIPGDVNVISFEENQGLSDSQKMTWAIKGDTLIIKYSNTRVYFGFSIDMPKDLRIIVPRDWVCDELEIDAASAQVRITDLTIDTVDFDGASGICKFENCTVRKLDMDTASGDIRFSGTLEELDCDAASASCTLVLSNTPRRIDADMASGDLDLTIPDNCGFTLKLNALSGDFTSDFTTTMNNDTHIYGDGSCRINVSAMSGDVIIRNAEDSAG